MPTFLDDLYEKLFGKTGNTSTDVPSSTPDNTFGSQLYDAIYAFGAGKVDAAKEKLQTAFLNTGEGKDLVNTATRQQLEVYFPIIVAILIGVFFFGHLMGRK